MKSANSENYVLGVVGGGAMGQGIAQVAVSGGIHTLIFDVSSDAAHKAVAAISGRLRRLVEKHKLDDAAAEAAIGRLSVAPTLADLSSCDAVVEAIVENLEVKRELFRELEEVVSADCLLASNTSSIPIASIASACNGRGRVAGLHFFNPVPLMRLVEVIRPIEATDETISTLTQLGQRLGRTPVEVKDSPGFLVNMGGRAMTTEGVRVLHESVATPAQVDAVMRDCYGFRMGPFELMDLTGIDVNYPVSRLVWEGYGNDPRITTYPEHRALLDAGLFGRKTGRGWFDYAEGAEQPSANFVPSAAPASKVALAEPNPDLEAFAVAANLTVVADDGGVPILAAPIGQDATSTALRTGADSRRLVCIDLIGRTDRRVVVMTAPGADLDLRDAVAAAFISETRAVTVIKDSPGFIGQRVAAAICNLGCYIAEVGLASPEDVDMALELGLNYPTGPLELGEQIGPQNVLDILTALQSQTGEDRYRPTLWLSRRARLGLPLKTAA